MNETTQRIAELEAALAAEKKARQEAERQRDDAAGDLARMVSMNQSERQALGETFPDLLIWIEENKLNFAGVFGRLFKQLATARAEGRREEAEFWIDHGNAYLLVACGGNAESGSRHRIAVAGGVFWLAMVGDLKGRGVYREIIFSEPPPEFNAKEPLQGKIPLRVRQAFDGLEAEFRTLAAVENVKGSELPERYAGGRYCGLCGQVMPDIKQAESGKESGK